MDTVIVLKQEDRPGGHVKRTVQIKKTRGQNFESGKHSLRITDGVGLEVFRRVQAKPAARRSSRPPHPSARPSASKRSNPDRRRHLRRLDHDGRRHFRRRQDHPRRAAAPGRGKAGQSAACLVSLDEHPAQIIRNAETLGLDLRGEMAKGTIHVLFDSPQELDIDAHLDQIIKTIEEHKIDRLLIDGMTSYSSALEDERCYREFFHSWWATASTTC